LIFTILLFTELPPQDYAAADAAEARYGRLIDDADAAASFFDTQYFRLPASDTPFISMPLFHFNIFISSLRYFHSFHAFRCYCFSQQSRFYFFHTFFAAADACRHFSFSLMPPPPIIDIFISYHFTIFASLTPPPPPIHADFRLTPLRCCRHAA